MSGPLTQRQRVCRLLRERGHRGITAADFLLPDVVDGGKPIARLAARIDEIRSRGLTVATEGKRGGYAIYVLRDAQHVAAAAPAPMPGAAAQLVPAPPRSAILGLDDVA